MRRARWLERLVLMGFAPDEIEDITHDVRELAESRSPRLRAAYYWTQLAKYPLRRRLDRLRHRHIDSARNREGRGGMGTWIQDTRYAIRALSRNPGFTVMAVAILTVSMGAAAAIFSVIDGVLLEPLPVEEPDRLVSLWLENGQGTRVRMTPGFFSDVQREEGIFEHVAAFGSETASISTGEEAVFLRGSRVTPAYFEALGVRPLLGRGFTPEEGEPGGEAVVVLSHHVWEQMFASDPGVLRERVSLDGMLYQVVGVVPPGVYPTEPTISTQIPFTASNQDFFVPLHYSEGMWANHRSHLLGAIARLMPSVSHEVAEERLDALSVSVQEAQPLAGDDRLLMTPFTEEVVGDVRFGLLTLLGTVGLVLLIAVTNVGALFLLRADDRHGQLAIRAALGASRVRLLGPMLLESALVVAISSVGALFGAQIVIRLMQSLVPYQIPRLADVSVEGTTLVVTVGVALVVALLFGVAPAHRLWNSRLAGHVSRGRQTSGHRQRRLHGAVVGVQAGLAVVVLVGAALLSRSYAELRAVDVGFEAEDAWTMSVPAPLETLQDVVLGVRELPGVAAAAITYDHPLSRSWGDRFILEGVERSDTDPPTGAALRPFGDDFATVGIPVVEGRVPDRVDMAGEVAYAVVNESFASTFFPDGSPVGARLVVPTAQRMMGTDGVFEISGVVGDVRFLGPDQPATPGLYVPLSHFPAGAATLVVRTERADVPVLAGVRAVVARIDPGVGVQRARRLGDILDDLRARARFNMMLLLTFGAIGLLLCGLGAYGLVGRVVAMRVQEIGVRMALGADNRRLARNVMGRALSPMLIGGAVGILVAIAFGRLVQSLLFEVTSTDPISFATAAVFVVVVGVVAAFVPTRRALSIDPTSALRAE